MKVRDLLNEKSRPVYTIGGQRSTEDAVRRMAEKNARALIVTDNDRPIGIFAERDVFRYYLRYKSTALFETALRNAMTDRLVTVGPEDEVSRVIAIMVQADITHLPVMVENKIIGMLTLNDLIERQLESLNAEIHQLKDYIEDLHEAGRD